MHGETVERSYGNVCRCYWYKEWPWILQSSEAMQNSFNMRQWARKGITINVKCITVVLLKKVNLPSRVAGIWHCKNLKYPCKNFPLDSTDGDGEGTHLEEGLEGPSAHLLFSRLCLESKHLSRYPKIESITVSKSTLVLSCSWLKLFFSKLMLSLKRVLVKEL